MARVYISIGSNIEREKNIRSAVRMLARRYGPLRLSSVYESAPVGFSGEPFYNLVAGLDTAETPETLITNLHAIEDAHDRVRNGVRFGPRTLDIDLLLYDDLIRHDRTVELPRREILEYAFVLGPLAEIAPDAIHPETRRRIIELWKNFRFEPDQLHPIEFEMQLP